MNMAASQRHLLLENKWQHYLWNLVIGIFTQMWVMLYLAKIWALCYGQFSRVTGILTNDI